jgi:hypothetical protein
MPAAAVPGDCAANADPLGLMISGSVITVDPSFSETYGKATYTVKRSNVI